MLSMVLIDIAALSNKPIPEWVYSVAPHLQGQPALVRFWCQSCLVAMTSEASKFPKGTLEDFIESVMQGGICQRKGNFGVCKLCSDSHKGQCGEVRSDQALRRRDADSMVPR
jgi:hypothetical protein